MEKELFAGLMKSVKQMDAIVSGKRKAARTFIVDAESIKVLRAKTGLTQEQFATLMQVELSTFRNWEQGRREPTGAAKALIRAIEKDPVNVLKALAA
jgi:putative transcriptional regulator